MRKLIYTFNAIYAKISFQKHQLEINHFVFFVVQ